MKTIRVLLILLLVVLIGAVTGSAVLAQGPGDGGGEPNCWACHRQPNPNTLSGAEAEIAFCMTCHGDPQVETWAAEGRTPVYVDPARYAQSIHSRVGCTACHADVARNPHQATGPVACENCHAAILTHVHMGAPHLDTDCAACHRPDLPVVRDPATGRIVLAETDATGNPVDRTSHALAARPGCENCHYAGNPVGAPAVTLPARSVLCMPCHEAAPIVKDPWSAVGLLVFLVGMTVNFSIYLRGELPGHPGATAMQKLSYIASDLVRLIFSRRFFRAVGVKAADAIFLRRVLQESVSRWVMHTLIYWPFLARFLLGLVTWAGEAFWPAARWTYVLADRDTPGVALFNDLCAALVILGVLIALYRRFIRRDPRLRTGVEDRAAISLLGAAFFLGILLEGVRMLSVGLPADRAAWAFLGYAVAAILRPLPLDWTVVYSALWYLHALLVIAVIAYLPFSKLLHIFITPIVAVINSVRGGHE
ncbi:MAG: cytochrome c3 family protein [Thermoflexales bacterium]|nr:cytochrome c3 family protein [Thermoflexales bacterium]